MKRNLDTQPTIALLLAGAFLLAGASAGAAAPPPKVEVAFALDTTGSMGGLIQGAKDKIWWIANKIIAGEPTPDLRIALVAYRDRGDDYVTRVFELTDDIDAVYGHLQSFQAQGGGDGPEHVCKALDDAVHRVGWSRGDDVLRIVYLVGDAPPHTDYDDGYDYEKTCAEAARSGIIVNTVRCGSWVETEQVWKEIARLAEGTYASIQQSGGVKVVTTPFDAELARLNRELEDTYLVYGSRERQAELEETKVAAKAMAAPMAAERASYVGKKGKARESEVDLVTAVEEGRADLGTMTDEELPPELRDLPPEERAAALARSKKRREEIKGEIEEVAGKRDAYLAQEAAKRAGSEPADGFDVQVVETLRKQAEKIDLTY